MASGLSKYVKLREQDRLAISKRFLHPNYKKGAEVNDIALLRLVKTVDFTTNCLPACLPDSETIFGTHLHLVSTDSDKIPMSFILSEECNKTYSDYFASIQRIAYDIQFCAKSGAGEKYTCQVHGRLLLLNSTKQN